MSTPVSELRSKVRSFQDDVEDAADKLVITCKNVPYKFEVMPTEFKRACIRSISTTERELAKLRQELEISHFIRDVEDKLLVEMEIIDHCFYTPTLEELKAAFQAVERVRVEYPAPVPKDIFNEDNVIPNKGWTQTYVLFKTAEEALKTLEMKTLTVRIREQTLITVKFGAAMSKQERDDWTKIKHFKDRLGAVQKQLTDLKAVETNDPYPFSVELSPILVVGATEDYSVQLKRAKERFSKGDATALSLLDKRPRVDLEEDKRRIQELNKERIEIIFELREFQAKGYDFHFDTFI